jgi:hypothetical protein
MLRSILAVVAGYLALAVLTMVCVYGLTLVFPDYALAGQTGSTPTLPVVFNLVLGTACAAAGGYLTAWIASRKRMVHVLVLAGLVFVFGIGHAFYGWGGPQPGWYLAWLPLLGAVGVLAGGWLGSMRPIG